MGRPKLPLIDPEDAITKALDLIDRDGIEGLTIRKLGTELGVHGASLYHYFRDKDEILARVRLRVLREGQVVAAPARRTTWQQDLVRSLTRLRAALLRHPNTAPMISSIGRVTSGLVLRERTLVKMLDSGVPPEHAYAIIDAAEALTLGSALGNPRQLTPRERLGLDDRKDELPRLHTATRAAPRSPDRLFQLQLRALLAGWESLARQSEA